VKRIHKISAVSKLKFIKFWGNVKNSFIVYHTRNRQFWVSHVGGEAGTPKCFTSMFIYGILLNMWQSLVKYRFGDLRGWHSEKK